MISKGQYRRVQLYNFLEISIGETQKKWISIPKPFLSCIVEL